MTKYIYIIIILLGTININANYILKTNSNMKESIQVESSANENGFYLNGKHKDTGTAFNNEGYDQEGYDINGLSTETCIYEATTDHIKTDGRYPMRIHYNGTTYYEYDTSEYFFSRGNLMWSTSYWNQRKYEVCVKNKKI
jgi:hypothetical protein